MRKRFGLALVLKGPAQKAGKVEKIVEDCGESVKAALGEMALDMPVLLRRLQDKIMGGARYYGDWIRLVYVHGQYQLEWGCTSDVSDATCSYGDPAQAFRELREALEKAEGTDGAS